MATIRKRINKAGEARYQAVVRKKGYPPQTATFNTEKKAQTWAKRTEVGIDDGKHFKTSEAKKHTFEDLIDRYLTNVMPRKSESQQRSQTYQLNWWKGQLGPYTLADVTTPMLAEKRDDLANQLVSRGGDGGKKRSNASANRYLAALSHVYSVAEREWGWVYDSPIKRVNRLKEPRGRVRFLSDEERKKLVAECEKSKEPLLYSLVVVAISTGARQGELLGLRWENVDFDHGVIRLLETKNEERRSVPIAGLAREALEKLSKVRRIGDDRVFPLTPDQLRWYFNSALRKVEIDDFRFHDLRHSAASYLAMNGATLAEIAEILGHKTLQMVKRYAHLTEQHTSRVVERMNKQIFGE